MANYNIPWNFKNLTGEKFGRLTVIEIDHKNENGAVFWKCLCDCGKYNVVSSGQLKNGTIVSCGCYQREVVSKINTKHGFAHKRLYKIFYGMKSRCYNKNRKDYEKYGGKGIKICDEWLDNFKLFYEWSIDNGYSDSLTIDRIDSSGDYTPSNCRWETRKIQSKNRDIVRMITYNGETHSLLEWSEILKINYNTLRSRIDKLNYSIQEEFTKK